MADIICRWRNGTPKTVVELVNSLPHTVMPISKFRESMDGKWNGIFFKTPYQLACQLGLYYEGDDGLYYPRFEYDINEEEAESYLEKWISRYYIPNPYIASDGFVDLATPTYVVKSLYDYVVLHPGCSYLTAYKDVFHEDLKNNDDIVRNYINNYSKVLKFDKNGTLSITKFDSTRYFSFMDRNDKKAFFDNFSDKEDESLMDQYTNADNVTRQRIFYSYLLSLGLSDSSCKQYAYTHAVNKEVLQIVNDKSGKNTLFEVVDVLMAKEIYNAVNALDTNKKQGHALSATIFNYRKFLDYLETGVLPEVAVSEHQSVDFSISAIIDMIDATGLQYDPGVVKRFVFALMAKPFVILSGLAGSGKTQLALAFAKAMIADKSQMCVVPVGADWTNREPLLGYPNALKSDEYVKPESGVLDLLIEAGRPENEKKPYFLILDEMNMSYVERYFADFLSAMESHEDIQLWKKSDESTDGVPASVKLSRNLFIIGTINVDETTYMFSPKVLDRANVIEFKISNDEMGDFLGNIRSIDRDGICGKAAAMAGDFIDKALNGGIIPDENIKDTLIGFFNELKSVNAEYGYRSATEIYRFIDVAGKNDDTKEKLDGDAILDAALVQKLLPKLHGSRKKLVPVLKTLWTFCGTEGALDDAVEVSEKVKFPLTADKVLRMYRSAVDNGFTSFSEA